MTDFNDLLGQAKKMQEKMKETQDVLKKIEVEGVSGGDAVKIIMNGEGELKKITFNDALYKESKEILPDSIILPLSSTMMQSALSTVDNRCAITSVVRFIIR